MRDIPEKVKKTSSDSLGGIRGSWQLLGTLGAPWGLLGEPGEVSKELWEAPYIDKTPGQPHSGRYVVSEFVI